MSSRAIKLVEQGDEAKGFAYACVPPNGPVRLAGSAYDATVGGSYSITTVAVAGTWVALDFKNTIDPHTSEEIEKVFDARSARSYRFFEAGIPEGPGFEEIPSETGSLEHVVLNRFGQLALALTKAGTTQIVALEPNGARRVLDSGPEAQLPPGSLKLDGHTVRWVDAGSTRRATI